ncbi:NAD(P)/FAD-dependent oxidoreductase [Candidatus Pelagibacter communis]|uniref:NAD(P)/FAD-dependent oxidoreductase n=1 Tax=Pelagibacter ubique TaxID=198252 RepID=UPI00094CC4F3|nr:FAD-dependent oxidoreductase [Candidatus Pelagibacter ubique]
MKNIYHSDIYKFEKPVNSYWEDTTKENFNLNKLTKDINSEVAIIGGGYTGLLCAINLIENYNLDVVLLEAGKVGWGASSRNGGFCAFPPTKTNFKNLQKIYGKDETKKFFKNSVEGSNYTKNIIKDYNIDCDVTGDSNFILAHHPNKFKQIKEQAEIYQSVFGIETELYSKEEFDKIGHTGTEQYGALSYKPGFAINPLKFVNGIARYALSKKLKIYDHSLVIKIQKNNNSYTLRTSEGSVNTKKIVVATNGFYQEGLVPQMNSRILPVISNIIVTRKLSKDEIDLHNFKTYSPIMNTKNLLYYYRKLPDNRILFGTRGDFIGSDQSNFNRSKKMEKFFKNIFPNWSKISIDYSWRGFIAMSQKLSPSIGKIDNEEIYYGFGYHGVGVSSAPWTGKQLSKLVFSSNSKDLNISKIYKGLPKKFIFPRLRVFYFRLAVLFYNIKDKLNI